MPKYGLVHVCGTYTLGSFVFTNWSASHSFLTKSLLITIFYTHPAWLSLPKSYGDIAIYYLLSKKLGGALQAVKRSPVVLHSINTITIQLVLWSSKLCHHPASFVTIQEALSPSNRLCYHPIGSVTISKALLPSNRLCYHPAGSVTISRPCYNPVGPVTIQ